ncbi:MAG TPA: tetratricopeptide repeat protein [Pirellulaceae bacterium]|nr:tetratricopeptide repeat protein [Pirellulaceae bacterium]HMO93352.1 tetratricopeptide repeat protein [Pirellulaceae bacterium]HMP70123.1 tetratricopeptide repeat protein [Pirellulaceae bacterium]
MKSAPILFCSTNNWPLLRQGALASGIVMLCVFALPLVAARADGVDKINAFLKHVDGQAGVADSVKAEINQTIKEIRDIGGDEQAISTGLLVMYPEYEKAVMDSDKGAGQAEASLAELAKSEDKFLAADASFFLARLLMSTDRHEDALDYLQRVTGELAGFTLHAGNAFYFLGVAQANLLKYEDSVAAFQKFLDECPNAPERLRVAAWRQLEVISSIESGSLTDVFQRMDFSRRRLELENTGEVTQEQQDEIVKMLQALIKEEEKKECSSCSSCKDGDPNESEPQSAQSESPGQGQSSKGGDSRQPDGVVRRSFDNGPASPWSRLRDRNRDAANNAIKERLPSRYRNVVEKYNEKVNEGDGTNN